MFRHHFLVDADFGRLCGAQAIVRSAAGRRAVLVSTPATKRSSVNLSLINNAKSASRIRRMLGNSRDVTAQLTALQQLAKLMQQQQGQAVTDQAEYRQRLQLANRLLSQFAQKVNKMTAGSICRLCFILSRLQASEVNTTPLRQAAARQLIQQQQDPTAAADNTSSHSGTAAAAAISSSATSTAAAAAGGSSSAVDTAAAAAAASWSAHVTPGDLLYLLRALHTWQGDDRDHNDEISFVLLPAAVAAAAAYAQKFSLQEFLMVVSILAKMNYYSADLMNKAAARFAAAAAAHSSGSAAAATQSSDLQQQQQAQNSDDLDCISDQIFVTYLWSNSSLAHVDQQQQQQQLLPAAVRLLLSSDSSSVQGSQFRNSNDSNAPAVSDHKSFSMPRPAPLLLLLQLKPKFLPMCAWSLAVMVISILARQSNQAASAAAAAGGGCSSTAAMQVSDSAVTAAGAAATAAAPDLQQSEQLVPLVTATVTLCELLAAAAAAPAHGSSSSDVINSRDRSTSSTDLDHYGLYDREGLAQLHHARILATAAAACCQQQLAYQQSSSAIYAENSSGSSSSSDLCDLRRDNAQYADLLQVVNAHIQQQQQATGADQVTSFRAACKQTWGCERPNTSHTQQQVCEELQRLGFSPHLELPALKALNLLDRSPNPQAISTPLGCFSTSDTAHTYNTHSHTYDTQAVGYNHLIWELKQVIGTEDHDADGPLNGLHVDIACVVPHTLAEKIQRQGLITVLQQIRSSGRSCTASAFHNISSTTSKAAAGSSSSGSRTCSSYSRVDSSSSSSNGSCETSGMWPSGGSSSDDLVVLAVEVDGPSHVAINNRSHLLGNTVCRNWLLQQLGYVVVTVSWWEWDAYCALSTMT